MMNFSAMRSLNILFVILAAAFATAAQPSGLRIAFNVLFDEKADDYEVFIMNADGTSKLNVTRQPDVAWTYSAIPGKVLFISDRNACRRCYFLYRSEADGANPQKITNLQLEDSWMGSRKGGMELVVAGRIDTRIRYQLFLVEFETGRFRRLTDEPNAMFRDPVFSPDGRKIAYVYKKNRTDRAEIEELYLMDANGTNRKKLTSYPADDPLGKDPGYKVGPPRWNAKRGFITYISNQNGRQSIYAVTPDGKKQWRLTENAIAEGWHDWSPDGDWLAFDARDPQTGRYDIYLMNFRTNEIKNLTGDTPFKYNQAPVFIEIKR